MENDIITVRSIEHVCSSHSMSLTYYDPNCPTAVYKTTEGECIDSSTHMSPKSAMDIQSYGNFRLTVEILKRKSSEVTHTGWCKLKCVVRRKMRVI